MGFFSRITPRVQRILGATAAGVALTGLATLGGTAGHTTQAAPPPKAPVPASQASTQGPSLFNSTFVTRDGKSVVFKAGEKATTRTAATRDERTARSAMRPATPVAAPKPEMGLQGLKPGQTFMDISKWQGNVDFGALKKAGITQVMMRSNYGTSTDSMISANYRAAVKAGIQPSLYSWVVPSESPSAQAHALVSLRAQLMKENPGAKPPRIMFDVEDSVNGAGLSRAQHVSALMQEIKAVAKATGTDPSDMMLYTGSYFWNDHYNSPAFGPKGLDMVVVDANYNFSPGDSINSIPWPNGLGKPDVVQYTSGAHFPGIGGRVDKNVVITNALG